MNNILILGNGGREKVIAEKLKNHNIHFYSENHFQKIRQFCLEKNIDLVIPSSEVYLCSGIKDALQKTLKNVKVYGPNKFQAKLEGSKYFSKKIMNELNLPTAEFAYFKTFNDVSTYIETFYKKKENKIL
uniref:Phosphoribosylglycinamide synthetase N-terminal domain-containing protein n=1 Tax=viral metagenome TaxID=1070528 RepID=A0A6C0CNS2_9ZZZZ